MINKFGKVFGKSEGKALTIGATILMLAINALSFSQIQINNVREGYYSLYDADSIKFDDKSTEMEAQQGLLNYELRTGKKGYWVPPNYRIDITENNIIKKEIEIDTIQAIRIKDLKGWIDFSDLGTKPSKGHAYLPFYQYAIINFHTDSIYNWQSKYNFQRTKSFGKTEYINLSIPFQYMEVFMIEANTDYMSIFVRITEKQRSIKAYLDNEIWREYNPGTSIPYEVGWEYYFNISKNRVNENPLFRLETTNNKGEVIIYKTILKI